METENEIQQAIEKETVEIQQEEVEQAIETENVDDEQLEWSEEMKSDYYEIGIIYDFLKILLKKWNNKNPSFKRHVHLRSYFYEKKVKIEKIKKERKPKYIRKTIPVDCKNGCGSQANVPQDEYVETNEYMCSVCERMLKKAYKRGKYNKVRTADQLNNDETMPLLTDETLINNEASL